MPTFARRGDNWTTVVDIGRDPVTGNRRRRRLTAPTQAELRDQIAELRLEGRRPTTRARTVGDLIEAWFAHASPGMSPTTRVGYRSKIDCYLTPAFGTLPLRQLTTDRIDALYGRIRKHGYSGRPLSASTVRKVHAILNDACAQGVRWRWLRANPCEHAQPGRLHKRDIDAPPVDAVRDVLAEASRDLADIIVLAVATGRRRGELCGVRWEDVDLKAGTIVFRRSIANIDGQLVQVVDERKSKRARPMAIDPGAVGMLTARLRDQRADALACRRRVGPASYVLSDVPGAATPFDPDKVSARFRVAARNAGVKVRFHDLRHFHITELIAAGIPTSTVIERAGWASGQMLDRYAHARAHVDRAAAAVIGNLDVG